MRSLARAHACLISETSACDLVGAWSGLLRSNGHGLASVIHIGRSRTLRRRCGLLPCAAAAKEFSPERRAQARADAAPRADSILVAEIFPRSHNTYTVSLTAVHQGSSHHGARWKVFGRRRAFSPQGAFFLLSGLPDAVDVRKAGAAGAKAGIVFNSRPRMVVAKPEPAKSAMRLASPLPPPRRRSPLQRGALSRVCIRGGPASRPSANSGARRGSGVGWANRRQ